MKELSKKINWGKVQGLVPVIVQDDQTKLVLTLGYMNREALAKTVETGMVWFYSRTKQRLWIKGETSGNILKVKDAKLDCDNDTLLVKVSAARPVCHTGNNTCFNETADENELQKLFATIVSRKEKLPPNSYTTSLFKAGADKISLKVAEESLEVIHAAQKETKKPLVEEAVDLVYHLWVLLVDKDVSLEQIQAEVEKRNKKPDGR